MRASGRGLTAGRERFSLRRALVVVQVALSLVLVAGALIFSRSLNKLETVDTGFRQDGILITQAGFARLNIAPERRLGFRREMLDGIRAIPGVEAAAETNLVPLSGNAWNNSVWMDGGDTQRKLDTSFSRIGPNYFKTLNIPLLAGRDFNDHDVAKSPKVAIVNETFARKLLDGVNPVGQRFRIRNPKFEIPDWQSAMASIGNWKLEIRIRQRTRSCKHSFRTYVMESACWRNRQASLSSPSSRSL